MNLIPFPASQPADAPPLWMPFPSYPALAPRTPQPAADPGQFAPLAGGRVLTVCDADNLDVGSKMYLSNGKFSYRTLAQQLCSLARSVELHSFFSSQPLDDSRKAYFRSRGYIAHDLKRQHVMTARGPR